METTKPSYRIYRKSTEIIALSVKDASVMQRVFHSLHLGLQTMHDSLLSDGSTNRSVGRASDS